MLDLNVCQTALPVKKSFPCFWSQLRLPVTYWKRPDCHWLTAICQQTSTHICKNQEIQKLIFCYSLNNLHCDCVCGCVIQPLSCRISINWLTDWTLVSWSRLFSRNEIFCRWAWLLIASSSSSSSFSWDWHTHHKHTCSHITWVLRMLLLHPGKGKHDGPHPQRFCCSIIILEQSIETYWCH